MPDKVVSLQAEREARVPHWTGEMLCLACGHKHTGVVPDGVFESECPECHSMRAVFTYPARPETAWRCLTCNNELYYIAPEQIVCAKCGLHSPWPENP